MKKQLLTLLIPLAALILYLSVIKIRSLEIPDSGLPLAVRWEGLYHDLNYRDVGESLNQCLGKPVFQTGLLSRSAVWFSGWSCDRVGNPELILSLNYSPEKAERYFCQDREDKVIGRYTNPDVQLADLEFIQTWDREAIREPACLAITEILKALANGTKTLVHCNAGRDRTGTVSALVAGLAAEESGMLSPEIIQAIECDYRKTASLDKSKYGRMERFLKQLSDSGGIGHFLQQRCGIDQGLITESTRNLMN